VTISAGQRRARPVIGADGRNSRIAQLAGATTYHDPAIARGIADAFSDADLVAPAVIDGRHGELEAALAEDGRQGYRCAIPLSDANLGIARLDMADGALSAAWSQMTELEQALGDTEAIGGYVREVAAQSSRTVAAWPEQPGRQARGAGRRPVRWILARHTTGTPGLPRSKT
jgi:2-polyprenyl-6-methoxyphenol hydroxylase-like FAD-dependent oxidoreductase